MLFKDGNGYLYENDFDFSFANTLVLSGGALKCIYFLGVLDRILEDKTINIINYAGTSCGAVVGFMLSMGYKPIEIYKFIVEYNINNENVTQVLSIMINKIRLLMHDKGINQNITFLEFYEQFGKDLRFVASNVTRMKKVIFCRQNYPNIPVLDAVKMSSCIPIIFPCQTFQNDIFVDGFFFDNFPVKTSLHFSNKTKIICIATVNSHYDKEIKAFYNYPYVYKFVFVPDFIKKYLLLTLEDKFLMFRHGYNYITKNQNQKQRRNSF